MSQTTLNGVNSATAQYLADKMSEHQQFLHKSAAVGMGGLIREELADVWDECRVPDWDGYNGFPVSWDAYNNAKRFLLALPLGVFAAWRTAFSSSATRRAPRQGCRSTRARTIYSGAMS